MTNSRILILLLALSISNIAFAQKDTTHNRTVVVENEYNPEILDASKINILPSVETPTIKKRSIEYIKDSDMFNKWKFNILPPIDNQINESYPGNGCVTAGYGNYGNIILKGKYLWLLPHSNRIYAEAGISGNNGTLNGWNNEDWKSRFYKSNASFAYIHDFHKISMKVGGKYISQVYNYMNSPATDKQNNSIYNIFASLKSKNEFFPIDFSFTGGYKYFGQKYTSNGFNKNKESQLFLNGDVWASINDKKTIGIEFDLNSLSYSSDNLNSFTSLCMNPYLNIINDKLRLRIGANVDIQTGDYKGIDASPNVLADYTISNGLVLYAHADGGRVINDFERLNKLSPYFSLNRLLPSTYTSLDSKIGTKFSPTDGLWLNIFGGYRIAKHELSYGYPSLDYYYTHFVEEKANCLYAGAEMKYNYKDKVEASLKTNYYKWSTKANNEELFLATKPTLTLDLYASGEVLEKLRIGVGYNFKQCGDIPNNAIIKKEIGDISNLYVKSTYDLFKGTRVFLDVNNILNKENYLENGYPVEKFNFIGGLNFTF